MEIEKKTDFKRYSYTKGRYMSRIFANFACEFRIASPKMTTLWFFLKIQGTWHLKIIKILISLKLDNVVH